MPDAKATYFDFRTEFDSVVQYSVALLNAQAGYKVRNERENYGEKIFGKMVCHALSLQKLLPNPNPVADSEIWDISSQYALSRAILESYEALSYILQEGLSEQEQELECRIIVWKLHAEERRYKMLGLIGSNNPATKEVEKNMMELRATLLDSKYVTFIGNNARSKIEKGDCPTYIVSRKSRLSSANVSIDYFNAVLMHLSSHVHTHPFSLHQLFDFKAGTPEAYSLVKVGGQYACGFLCAAVRDLSRLFAPRIPEMPKNVQEALELWGGVLKKGVNLS